ncbi:MAG: DUF3662 and FHA domain-containing protein [Actinomycetes bacterium]
MSVLRTLESRIAGLVEGTFSRAFRSEVRPVEIARRLTREMDANRAPLVSRVYAPTSYTVFLGDEDYDRFAPHEVELKEELSSYLLEHARREELVLSETPVITIARDSALGLGEFGIKTTPVDREALGERRRDRQERSPAPIAPVPPRVTPPPAAFTPPPVAAPVPVPTPPLPGAAAPAAQGATLTAAGHLIELDPSGTVLGRSRSCDVVLEDPNASREHARLRLSGAGWTVEDLGSTNGVDVNGARIAGPTSLTTGDLLRMGHTELVFKAG